MPFFLPRKLVDLEYLVGESDEEYANLARSYRKELDLAFFVANLGFTKSDYEELTYREVAFIRKAWETAFVRETSVAANAVQVGYVNASRKRQKKPASLWTKVKVRRLDGYEAERFKAQAEAIRLKDEKEGNRWYLKILASRGGLSDG